MPCCCFYVLLGGICQRLQLKERYELIFAKLPQRYMACLSWRVFVHCFSVLKHLTVFGGWLRLHWLRL